jgi:hypothetical protein
MQDIFGFILWAVSVFAIFYCISTVFELVFKVIKACDIYIKKNEGENNG